MYEGWYLVAFESELAGDVTPVTIGDTSLVLVAGDEGVRAFDARCPHRGANLGYGGELVDGAIVCPFHGKTITLGKRDGAALWVEEYLLLGYGGMLFVRLTERHENGLSEFLEELVDGHLFMPCHVVPIAAPGELVVENAFDETHFGPVHGVLNEPRLAVTRAPTGALIGEGTMEVPVTPWQLGEPGTILSVPLTAHAFSPQLVFSYLGGDNPYWVITGTVPDGDGGCAVRQAFALPNADGWASSSDVSRLEYLASAARGGLEQDRVIWENIRSPQRARFGPEDAAVVAFRSFCNGFRPRG